MNHQRSQDQTNRNEAMENLHFTYQKKMVLNRPLKTGPELGNPLGNPPLAVVATSGGTGGRKLAEEE